MNFVEDLRSRAGVSAEQAEKWRRLAAVPLDERARRSAALQEASIKKTPEALLGTLGLKCEPSLTKRGRATEAVVEARRWELFHIIAQMRPMTVRQASYQATVRGIVEKSEAGYSKVQTDLTVMRRSGDLPYGWLADNTRSQRKPRSFGGIEEALQNCARFYRKDLWRQADAYVEMWLEKDALSGVVLPVTAEYDVPIMVARGYASLSFLHSAAEAINELAVPAYIYHLGDFDPSGVNAGEKIEETLRELAPHAEIHFERLAVTPEQIAAWDLPTRPTKQSDTRARGFGDISVELDAIPPDYLRVIVREAIRATIAAWAFRRLESRRGKRAPGYRRSYSRRLAMTGVEITRLVKDHGPLTKRVHLAPDGTIANDSTDCRMSRGVMHRMVLPDWRDYAAVSEETPSNVAYALGAIRGDLPATVRLVAKADPQSGQAGFAARTAGTIQYSDQPGLVLLDFDIKAMPENVRAALLGLGGFCAALETVCPGLAAAGHIRRKSTSAGIYHSQTGATYSSGGEHVYVLVHEGTDAKRFLYTLHDRCWLAGLGWYIVGKAGQLLERSIVDRAVCAAERLVFEANPDLEPPLAQEKREATIHDGTPVDTRAACADLSGAEAAELQRRKAAAAHALRKEAEAAKKAFVGEQIEKAVACGIDRHKARLMAEQWGKGILRPGVIVEFDDPDLGAVSIADVLANLDHYDGETLADPIEGVDYGRNCAVVQVRSDGVYIFSFAHGGGLYKLCHDYASVEAAVLSGAKYEAVNILCRLVFRADLDSVERKLLTKLAGKRSGAGLRAAEANLKEEGARQTQQAAEARRRLNLAHSTKARLEPPLPDDEAGPVMATWDDILSHIDALEPPMRDVEGWPVQIQCRETAGLHELTAKAANDEEDEKSRLPPPKNFLLTKHDKYSLEIEIGSHISFVQETSDGERYVAPADKFLIHDLKYPLSKLPRAHAVLTMPLVLPNGELLDRNGLDRERRAVFRIDPALLEFMPKPEECTEDDVAKAYKFLVDEWLVDVATDTEGKCVLLAYALSIIERVLFPERPVFFVTAGARGGGKTTALIMATLAATGTKPAAAAWTNDSEERKKSLFAIFREGLPTVIWDNIPRGLAISCPHIERASTTEIYQDRILGVSQQGQAPAYTIMAFTGNNIRPKSDQASRSLEARLTADRPDPENRSFVHPEPVGWTLDHRGEILRALYVILLGNPQLRPLCRREAQTRFKRWWQLVGSAVEHAAEAVGQIVSFKAMFARVEGNDDEAAARAEILQTLYAIKWPVRAEIADKEFTSANLLARLDENAKNAEQNSQPEDAETAELRRFCTPKNAKAVSSKTIGLALKAILDAPVAVLAGMLALRSRSDTHNKITVFWVELKLGKP